MYKSLRTGRSLYIFAHRCPAILRLALQYELVRGLYLNHNQNSKPRYTSQKTPHPAGCTRSGPSSRYDLNLADCRYGVAGHQQLVPTLYGEVSPARYRPEGGPERVLPDSFTTLPEYVTQKLPVRDVCNCHKL